MFTCVYMFIHGQESFSVFLKLHVLAQLYHWDAWHGLFPRWDAAFNIFQSLLLSSSIAFPVIPLHQSICKQRWHKECMTHTMLIHKGWNVLKVLKNCQSAKDSYFHFPQSTTSSYARIKLELWLLIHAKKRSSECFKYEVWKKQKEHLGTISLADDHRCSSKDCWPNLAIWPELLEDRGTNRTKHLLQNFLHNFLFITWHLGSNPACLVHMKAFNWVNFQPPKLQRLKRIKGPRSMLQNSLANWIRRPNTGLLDRHVSSGKWKNTAETCAKKTSYILYIYTNI